ncbi:MAG: pyrimidine utilization protein C [Alphaproteobacteria bacterium]|nr:pyrimidine utilization protein C [Alphaproteobacteria bacterium]
MPQQPIIPSGAGKPLAPYSLGTRAGRTVYVAGTVPVDAEGNTVAVGDVRAQTRHVLETIRRVIEAAGGSLADVAFNQVFLKDYADYAAMNEVYATYFPANPPARYCIKAELVRPEFLIEIAATAYLGE